MISILTPYLSCTQSIMPCSNIPLVIFFAFNLSMSDCTSLIFSRAFSTVNSLPVAILLGFETIVLPCVLTANPMKFGCLDIVVGLKPSKSFFVTNIPLKISKPFSFGSKCISTVNGISISFKSVSGWMSPFASTIYESVPLIAVGLTSPFKIF